LTQAKLSNIDAIVCYTDFVKKHLDKTFHKNAKVIYPPVPSIATNSRKKENIILTVGRFTKAMNAKKQEELIGMFKELTKMGLQKWKFVLIGSYLPGDRDFVEKIKESASGYPIEIITNASYAELTEYYGKAKIYWHAAGFGEDLEKYPERAEHFGITTVEAMSAECVPVIINAGGQPEIVEDGKSGFLWRTKEELLHKTQVLIEDKATWEKMSLSAKERARDFSEEKFCEEIRKLVEHI
jgi:glycosyltransferase involved in cell wall biosynthesis